MPILRKKGGEGGLLDSTHFTASATFRACQTYNLVKPKIYLDLSEGT